MYNKPAASETNYSFLTVLILLTLLAACAPTGTATPETAVVDPATAEFTETATVTITATPAPTFTATPSTTPTETLSPEEAAAAEQAAIRAEVLSYGINLDDLANSENKYIRNHPSVESFQEELNNDFGENTPNWEMMVVLEIEQLKNVEEFDEAFTTDSGWKFMAWAKAAYKDAAGDWVIANLPLSAYNENEQEMWFKSSQNAGPYVVPDITYEAATRSFSYSDEQAIINLQESHQMVGNYYLDTGAVFRLLTEYPDPTVHLNTGEVGEIPRFTETELEQFRLTGDPSVFGYQATDGAYFIWPFVHYSSDICRIDYQAP